MLKFNKLSGLKYAYTIKERVRTMKKWYMTLAMLLLPVFLTACVEIEFVKPGETEAPAQTETVQENPEQEGPAEEIARPVEEVPAEELEAQNIQPVEESDFEKYFNEEGILWDKCIGVWSTGAGVQTDPAASYHNYYVCLFDNGTYARFGWQLMDVGTWLKLSDTSNAVLAMGTAACSSGAFEGWTAHGGADMVTYAYDADANVLRMIESVSENLTGDTYWAKTYYPANRADAYEACARYLSYLKDLTWETDIDSLASKTETETVVLELREGLRAVSGMPSQLKNHTELDLTKGYWYQFSSQTANCSEYQFFADGTVHIRERDVMEHNGAYIDELYPEDETYAIRKRPYQVTQTGNVIVDGTEMVMAPTLGQLVYSFTEEWHDGKVFSRYLKQFDHRLSLEEMKYESGVFAWAFWNANVVVLDE